MQRRSTRPSRRRALNHETVLARHDPDEVGVDERALVVMVLSINLLGDWLRDALNPRLR